MLMVEVRKRQVVHSGEFRSWTGVKAIAAHLRSARYIFIAAGGLLLSEPVLTAGAERIGVGMAGVAYAEPARKEAKEGQKEALKKQISDLYRELRGDIEHIAEDRDKKYYGYVVKANERNRKPYDAKHPDYVFMEKLEKMERLLRQYYKTPKKAYLTPIDTNKTKQGRLLAQHLGFTGGEVQQPVFDPLNLSFVASRLNTLWISTLTREELRTEIINAYHGITAYIDRVKQKPALFDINNGPNDVYIFELWNKVAELERMTRMYNKSQKQVMVPLLDYRKKWSRIRMSPPYKNMKFPVIWVYEIAGHNAFRIVTEKRDALLKLAGVNDFNAAAVGALGDKMQQRLISFTLDTTRGQRLAFLGAAIETMREQISAGARKIMPSTPVRAPEPKKEAKKEAPKETKAEPKKTEFTPPVQQVAAKPRTQDTRQAEKPTQQAALEAVKESMTTAQKKLNQIREARKNTGIVANREGKDAYYRLITLIKQRQDAEDHTQGSRTDLAPNPNQVSNEPLALRKRLELINRFASDTIKAVPGGYVESINRMNAELEGYREMDDDDLPRHAAELKTKSDRLFTAARAALALAELEILVAHPKLTPRTRLPADAQKPFFDAAKAALETGKKAFAFQYGKGVPVLHRYEELGILYDTGEALLHLAVPSTLTREILDGKPAAQSPNAFRTAVSAADLAVAAIEGKLRGGSKIIEADKQEYARAKQLLEIAKRYTAAMMSHDYNTAAMRARTALTMLTDVDGKIAGVEKKPEEPKGPAATPGPIAKKPELEFETGDFQGLHKGALAYGKITIRSKEKEEPKDLKEAIRIANPEVYVLFYELGTDDQATCKDFYALMPETYVRAPGEGKTRTTAHFADDGGIYVYFDSKTNALIPEAKDGPRKVEVNEAYPTRVGKYTLERKKAGEHDLIEIKVGVNEIRSEYLRYIFGIFNGNSLANRAKLSEGSGGKTEAIIEVRSQGTIEEGKTMGYKIIRREGL